jgi:hypothetical protein
MWTGFRSPLGYGKWSRPRHEGGTIQAHRYAWLLTNGSIPPGMCVLHRCDNPPCVNPSHLWIGTLKDNVQDMLRKGRAKGGPPSRLTKEEWREAAILYWGGAISMRALARSYGARSHSAFARMLLKYGA